MVEIIVMAAAVLVTALLSLPLGGLLMWCISGRLNQRRTNTSEATVTTHEPSYEDVTHEASYKHEASYEDVTTLSSKVQFEMNTNTAYGQPVSKK